MDRAKQNKWLGRAFAVAALSAVAAMTACAGGTTTPGSTRTAAKKRHHRTEAVGGGPMSLVTAVDMIATERCAHEGACDRLGPGRRFRDNDSCQKEFVQQARTKLDSNVCDTGFVETETLLECLTAIRSGTCTTDTENACQPRSMCSP